MIVLYHWLLGTVAPSGVVDYSCSPLYFDVTYTTHHDLCVDSSPDHISALQVIQDHYDTVTSGCHNYQGCQISIHSHLAISERQSKLKDFSDRAVIQCLEFVWSIGVTCPVV